MGCGEDALVPPERVVLWVGRKGDTNFCELPEPERFSRRPGRLGRRFSDESQFAPSSLVCAGLRCRKRRLRRYNTRPTTTSARKSIAPVTDPITVPSTLVPAPRAAPGVTEGDDVRCGEVDEGPLDIVEPGRSDCDVCEVSLAPGVCPNGEVDAFPEGSLGATMGVVLGTAVLVSSAGVCEVVSV